eukprot:5697269-Prymnesium_polylepis.3
MHACGAAGAWVTWMTKRRTGPPWQAGAGMQNVAWTGVCAKFGDPFEWLCALWGSVEFVGRAAND